MPTQLEKLSMNIPVHKSNLIPSVFNSEETENFIFVEHWYYDNHFLEIWKKLIGPFYLYQTTVNLDKYPDVD